MLQEISSIYIHKWHNYIRCDYKETCALKNACCSMNEQVNLFLITSPLSELDFILTDNTMKSYDICLAD